MKYSILVIAVFVSTFLISCSNSRNKMSETISKLESDMKTSHKVDSVAVNELLSAYQNFSSKYPDDSLSPEYLYKGAGLASYLNRGTQAIDLYETIIHTYPDYEKLPECYFMEAFTFENTLENVEKAKEIYTTFLAKYPDHELADDARTAIKFLGKSPEEIVHGFDTMNAESLKK